MKLEQLSEVLWRFYQEGEADVKKQRFRKQDILQMAKMAFSNSMRTQYYLSKNLDEYRRADYSFVSPLFAVKRFPLSEPDTRNMRRADMSDFDLYRMPKNSHIPNVYPVGGGCAASDANIEITQVEAGEENFYLNNPDLSFFTFFVVKGRGVNCYNIPPCVKSVDIETTYESSEIDVSLDIAYDVSLMVLGQIFKVKGSWDNDQINLKAELQKQEGLSK